MALGRAFGGGVNPLDIRNKGNVCLPVLPPCLNIIRLEVFLGCDRFEFFAHFFFNMLSDEEMLRATIMPMGLSGNTENPFTLSQNCNGKQEKFARLKKADARVKHQIVLRLLKGGTAMTGQGASSITASATLPKKNLGTPFLAFVLITIMSMP
jgi:hypothetical protein